MGLPSEAYEALEDIVGPEYVTRDPVILDTYNQVWGNKLVFDEKWSVRPAAVLLPGSTEEVQAIVKACNRYRVPFKPFSSGFEITATALEYENSIVLDLRRMGRILEIDAKNMYAVVEPYVSVHRLHLEAAKYGLFNSTIGSGPSTGVIASACCHFGSAETHVFTGGLDRNTLGVEWVLPSGDILKLGTVGTGGGWFTGGGPGIDLRGILRGHAGANGGNGVITKAAIKLYPWYGPPEWRLEGSPPYHKQLERVPDGFKAFLITFPDEDALFDAMREVAKAEIGFTIMALGQFIGLLLGEGNDEGWEIYNLMGGADAFKVMNTSMAAILGAASNREMEYREKCLLKISEGFGGLLIPPLNDPKMLAGLFPKLVWAFQAIVMAFRMTGEFFVIPSIDGTQDMIKKARPLARKLIEPRIAKGHLLDAGMDMFCVPFENYSVGCHLENIYRYDPWDTESAKSVRELLDEAFNPQGEFARFGVAGMGGGLQVEPAHHVHKNWSPVYENYGVWLSKIRAMLDPNKVTDGGAYIPPVFP
jgi:glycolate oxidase